MSWAGSKTLCNAFTKAVRKAAKEEREQKVINKYKLEESIRTKLRKLGVEDLVDDIKEYINLIKEEEL